jgi:hypothetical protein
MELEIRKRDAESRFHITKVKDRIADLKASRGDRNGPQVSFASTH